MVVYSTSRSLGLDTIDRDFELRIRFSVEGLVNARVFWKPLVIPSARVEKDLPFVVAAIGAEEKVPVSWKKLASISFITVIGAFESHTGCEC